MFPSLPAANRLLRSAALDFLRSLQSARLLRSVELIYSESVLSSSFGCRSAHSYLSCAKWAKRAAAAREKKGVQKRQAGERGGDDTPARRRYMTVLDGSGSSNKYYFTAVYYSCGTLFLVRMTINCSVIYIPIIVHFESKLDFIYLSRFSTSF